jgi:hypothetical protein
MNQRVIQRSHYRRSHLQENPEESGLAGLIKNAVPLATSFGVSRIGSGIISKVVSRVSQKEFVVKATPVISSLLFVGVTYLLTGIRFLKRYRTAAIVGSTANAMLTLVAQLIPSSKPLMGLKGWDYSHAQPFAKHIPGPDMDLDETWDGTRKSEEVKKMLALEPGDREETKEDLNTGVFAGKWSF